LDFEELKKQYQETLNDLASTQEQIAKREDEAIRARAEAVVKEREKAAQEAKKKAEAAAKRKLAKQKKDAEKLIKDAADFGLFVRDAKLDKKIGRLQATVLRPNGPNKPPIRMDVDFDDTGKRVMEGQNYSLRPGDHIVISHDNRTAMGEWFNDLVPSIAKGRK
jgi:hypothetical protein